MISGRMLYIIKEDLLFLSVTALAVIFAVTMMAIDVVCSVLRKGGEYGSN